MAGVALREDIPAEKLRRLARLERDGRVCARLLALANILDGMSREAAARHAGMDRQTLRDWVHRFNAEGVEGLRDRPRPGRPVLLAQEGQADLKNLVLAGPAADDAIVEFRVADIRALSCERWGADYSRSGMQKRLCLMGLSYQKPRPIHPQTDTVAQEIFKKTSPPPSPGSPTPTPGNGSKCGVRTRLGWDRKGH